MISRRLRKRPVAMLSIVVIGMLVVSACGSTETDFAPTPTTAPAQQPAAAATAMAGEAADPAAPAATAVPTPTTAVMTGPAPGEPRYGGLLQVTVSNEPNTLDPASTQSIHDLWQMRFAYDALIEAGNDLSLLPGVAESWDTPNNTTIIFHLQKDVKFQDGTPFNAEAVKFSWDRIFDPPLPRVPETQNQMAAVESWEVVDELTIQVNLSRPSASIMIETWANRSGMIPSPTAVKSVSPEEFARKPVSTGPFKVVRWISGSHVEFERNENYWREGLPYLDRIRSQFNVDPAVEVAQLQTGELDVLDSNLPPTEVPKWRDKKDFILFEFEDPVHRLIQFNRGLEPWTNRDLRLALSYAIDREGFCQAVYQGLCTAGVGVLHPNFGWAFDPDWKGIQLDPDKAREHLAAAGVELPFTFTANTHNRADGLSQATAVQASVNKNGFDMKINPIRASVNSSMFHNEKITPLYFAAGRSTATDPNTNFRVMFHSTGRANPSKFVHPGLDDQIDAADSTFDHVERARLYRQIDKIVIEEEAYTIIIGYNLGHRVIADFVKNYEPHPHRYGTLTFAQAWLDK